LRDADVPVEELEPAGRVTLWLYCDDADDEIFLGAQ
jgi:hypothetical protein